MTLRQVVDGVVDGVRLWVEDVPWWACLSWDIPIRPEDGMLDWAHLTKEERDAVVRISWHLHHLWGRLGPLPQVAPPTPGMPCKDGWSMRLSHTSALLDLGKEVESVQLAGYHEVNRLNRFAVETVREGERWLALRQDGIAWSESRRAGRVRVPSVWVDVEMWRFEDGYLDMGAEVVRPDQVVNGQLRTIWIDRWPDASTHYGIRPGAGTPAPRVAQVNWNGEYLWFDDRQWWRGLVPALQNDPERPDKSKLSPTWRRAFDSADHYRYYVKAWDRPIPRYPRWFVEGEARPFSHTPVPSKSPRH